jgi:hypothetical protein
VTKDYSIDYREALRDLLDMAAEREALETQIAKQKKRVAALYELVKTDDNAAAIDGLVEGMTDACRVVFRAAEKPLTPAEVRDRVQALGIPPQSNLLASVHTTIKRMKDAGEVTDFIDKDNPIHQVAYRWDFQSSNGWTRLAALASLQQLYTSNTEAMNKGLDRVNARRKRRKLGDPPVTDET